jgi:uncharacterized protein (DUF4415 family)
MKGKNMKKNLYEFSDEIPEIPRGAQFRKSRHEVSPNAQMPKRTLRLGLETDIWAWFQAEERNGGLNCEEHINQALRQYIITLIGDEPASIAPLSKKQREEVQNLIEETLAQKGFAQPALA